MAKTRVSFRDCGEFAKWLESQGAKLDAGMEEKIILAGAAAAEAVFREGIRGAHKVTGALADSVGHTELTVSAAGTLYTHVTPTGNHRDGTRSEIANAKRAYIIDRKKSSRHGVYGRHKSADPRYKGTGGDRYITKSGGIHDQAMAAANAAMIEEAKRIMGE